MRMKKKAGFKPAFRYCSTPPHYFFAARYPLASDVLT